jgi:hypothetical protein
MSWKHHGCTFESSGALPQRQGALSGSAILRAGEEFKGMFCVDSQVATATKSSELSCLTMSRMQSGDAA